MRLGDRIQLLDVSPQQSSVTADFISSYEHAELEPTQRFHLAIQLTQRHLGLSVDHLCHSFAMASNCPLTSCWPHFLYMPQWARAHIGFPSLLPVLPRVQAIVVYTDKEVHGAVGSRVTLHCSFWSSEWVSDDISFTWRYQPEGGRDAISVSAWGSPGIS